MVEVEHVKAHRTKKDKKEMSQFEKFVTEGNEKADELAKKEQCWTKDLWRKQEQRQCSRSEKRCMQLCSMQPVFTAWWKNGRIAMSSSRSKKKSGFSLTRKERKRNIELSGVLRPTSIDA